MTGKFGFVAAMIVALCGADIPVFAQAGVPAQLAITSGGRIVRVQVSPNALPSRRPPLISSVLLTRD